jgi:hypothetical protein
MDSTLEGKKCLASIALFGELAKRKLDVYSTLAEFIIYCISDENLYSFSLFKIKNSLVTQFGFSIPEIVIKNAIKKIPNMKIDNHNYSIEKSIKLEEDFDGKRKEIEESHNKILSDIYKYISDIKKRDLSETEKNDIYDTFFNLLIQKKSIVNEYSKYINAFIIENECNEEIIKRLNIIHEGVLIYSAFQYTPEEYSKNTWTENMVLYFDTELLFSLYGLNGKLYQNILEELFDLIKIINRKNHAKEKIIELRYFNEIEQEINHYFNAAGNKIQSDGQIEFQQSVAMLSILNGCKDITQVMEKKAMFFQKLKYLGFEEDKKNYYENEEIFQYNILSEDVCSQILQEFPLYEPKKIDENLKYLNKIAILRKGKNSTRRSSKYFFVTATSVCLNIANNSHVLHIDSVPLTTTVEYLTEKFWIKLNKNFAKINLLNSNVVIRAQLVIKAQLNIAITEKTTELEKRYKENNMNLESANAVYSELKKVRNYSETVTHDNIDQIIHFTEGSIDNFVDNYNFEKEESEKTRKENIQLKSTNKEMSDKLQYFEAREERKKKIISNLKYFFKIVLLVFIMMIPIVLIIFAQIHKDKYSVFLSILGTIGAFLSVCNFINFFTGFFSKIKKLIKRN